jgi:hypothetical protein
VVRRVLALVLLGVVVVVCAALAASESLRNDSRKTASAVTIQFSDSVRITSWDTSTFATCSPSSGRASTFRFSGGQFENGARFSVSWTPSTAEITGTEWETTGSASAGSTASGAPLTYEQIMAQIAHYPGPDEPVYVPAEGEMMWLTDLEGHADMYDNDSIKINYAPGFDKDQITRIEVYRNGVKLGFVPVLFDVLTNDQMKTFDGKDPVVDWSEGIQDSPKSNHTDHAIMGYKYLFRFYKATSSVVEKVLVTTVKSGVRWHPAQGVYACFYGDWPRWIDYFHLTPAQILEYMKKLRAAGFDGVTIEWNMFADSFHANEVVTQPSKPEYLASMWGAPLTTMPMDKFELMVASAKQAGLAVEIKGHVFMSAKWEQENPGTFSWSANVDPQNPESFLDSVFASMAPVLEMCERHGVERADLLTEMVLLERHEAPMKAFLDKVAGVFSGQLSIDSVSFDRSACAAGWNGAATFWDWTDGVRHLAINESNWWPVIETQNDQRLSTMLATFVQCWTATLSHFRAAYPGSFFSWGEIGSFPVDGVARGAEYFDRLDFTDPGLNDIQEFNDSYATFLLGSKALGVDGACVYFVSLCDVEPLNVYKSSIFTNSSTMALISSIIGP